jgi:hypothetical protein
LDGVVLSYVGDSHRYSAELTNSPLCSAASAAVPVARITHDPASFLDSK